MSVKFARPSSSGLVFHVYGRSVHPELFYVFAEKELWRDAYRAVIRICDAGHIVDFRYDNTTVTEVTATRQQSLPQKKRFLDKRLRGSRDESFRFENGLQYQVSYQLEQLDPEVYINFHEELLLDCGRVAVAHRFPSANRFSPEPLSLVRADANYDSLLIHAYHTFPESYSVVKTQSLFEL